MTSRPAPACFECRHLSGHSDNGMACAAFPDGIPSAVYFGEIGHLKPLPGDNGIQWEAAEGVVGFPVLRISRGCQG
jgi:hypothetical protein